MANRSPELPALTGLRAAAALAIVLLHYGGQLVAWAPEWVNAVRTGGHVWVGLFYVLSGFVLGRANAIPLDRAARRAFWVSRASRLYPAYLVAMVLSTPAALEAAGRVGGASVAAGGIASLLMVQAWFPPIAFFWNAPGWSTSVVASFYLLFPFAAGWLARLPTRRLALAGAAAWCASLAFPAAWLALQPDGPVVVFTEGEPTWLRALKFHPIPRAGEFLAGLALGLLHARGTLAVPAGAAGAALAAVVVVLATGAAPFVLLHNGLLVPLFAVAIVALARGEGLVARALSTGPLRALGEASFALYALQEPLYRIARSMPGAPLRPKPAFLVLYLVGTCLVAVAVTRWIEQPVRRAVRGAWQRTVPRRPRGGDLPAPPDLPTG